MTDGYARRALGGTVQADPAPEGGGRRVEGLAVPWAAEAQGTVEFGDLAERFDPASFDGVIAQARRVPLLDRHDGNVVGMAEVYAAADGLRFRGTLLAEDPAADAYARRVAAGADGVSIEFRPGRVRRAARSVTHLAVDRLAAIAGAYAPALDGASVALRKENTMPETETPEAPEAEAPAAPSITVAQVESIATAVASRQAADLRRLLAEGNYHQEAPGLAFRSLAEAWRAIDAHQGDPDHHQWYQRALADIITTDAPGVMSAGMSGQVRNIIDPGRPGITAFGREALAEGGMSVDWPTFSGTLTGLVGKQATEKTDITSAKVPITKGSAALATYAGGADISYQLLRRSSPSYLEAWSRIMLAAYGVVTNTAFVDAVEGTAGLGGITLDFATATAAQIGAALFGASVKVQDATGRPAEFVLASASAFIAIGKALTPGPVFNSQGTAEASTLRPVISGLPVIYDPAVNAGTVLVSNRLAAAFHEDGPFQAQEEDVARLGRNVAYWGMGTAAVYTPKGVVVMGAAVVPAADEDAPAPSRSK